MQRPSARSSFLVRGLPLQKRARVLPGLARGPRPNSLSKISARLLQDRLRNKVADSVSDSKRKEEKNAPEIKIEREAKQSDSISQALPIEASAIPAPSMPLEASAIPAPSMPIEASAIPAPSMPIEASTIPAPSQPHETKIESPQSLFNPEDFEPCDLKDTALLPPFEPFDVLIERSDGQMVCLTKNAIQLLTQDQNGYQVVAERKGTYKSLFVSGNQIIAHQENTLNVHVIPGDLRPGGYVLGPASHVQLGNDGILYTIEADEKENYLKVWDRSIRKILMTLVLPNDKECHLMKDGVALLGNGDLELFGLMGLDFKPLGKHQNLLIYKPLEQGYIGYEPPNSHFTHLWDNSNKKEWKLPIHNWNLLFIEPLLLDGLFLLRVKQGKEEEFYLHHKCSDVLYPLGLNGLKFHSYTLLQNGFIRFCLSDKENNLFLRDLCIPYIKNWSKQAFKALAELSWESESQVLQKNLSLDPTSPLAKESRSREQLTEGMLTLIEGYLGLFTHRRNDPDLNDDLDKDVRPLAIQTFQGR